MVTLNHQVVFELQMPKAGRDCWHPLPRLPQQPGKSLPLKGSGSGGEV